MGLGATRGLTQVNPLTDNVRDGADAINRLGDELAALVAYHGAEAAASNTDATGFKTVNHGLGFIPSSVIAQSMLTGGTSATLVAGVDTITNVSFRIRFFNVAAISTSQVRWIAFK